MFRPRRSQEKTGERGEDGGGGGRGGGGYGGADGGGGGGAGGHLPPLPGGLQGEGNPGGARDADPLDQHGGAAAAHDAHAGLTLAQQHQESQGGGQPADR